MGGNGKYIKFPRVWYSAELSHRLPQKRGGPYYGTTVVSFSSIQSMRCRTLGQVPAKGLIGLQFRQLLWGADEQATIGPMDDHEEVPEAILRTPYCVEAVQQPALDAAG